jgi:hypothetical protein
MSKAVRLECKKMKNECLRRVVFEVKMGIMRRFAKLTLSAILLMTLLGFASNGEILSENYLPSSLGLAVSSNVGLLFSWEMPTTVSHSVGINAGVFDISGVNGGYRSLELNFLEHLGNQKTNAGWFYRGIGAGAYQPYLADGSGKGFLSLFFGGRHEFEAINIYGEIYSMISPDNLRLLLRIGLRIDAGQFPYVPVR